MARQSSTFKSEIPDPLYTNVAINESGSFDGDTIEWRNIKNKLKEIEYSGTLSNDIINTYSLAFTTTAAYSGGVISADGETHFIPYAIPAAGGIRGQKINKYGVISTYTFNTNQYGRCRGGLLISDGSILFCPGYYSEVLSVITRRLSVNNIMLTSSNMFDSTNNSQDNYWGGILSPSGDVFLVPYTYFTATASKRLKIESFQGSTYTLVYTLSGGYRGGVLSSTGQIHFVPYNAVVGQKITSYSYRVQSPDGTTTNSGDTINVSTYSLIYTASGAYDGGVINHDGDVHFIPSNAVRGQKISASGVVSTYSLVYTTTGAYAGGVVAPNGDIHFVPYNATVGQKVSAAGVVSTYSLAYTTTGAYSGGILNPQGEIHFVPYNATVGQKISTFVGTSFPSVICMSPFFNKY